MNPNNFLIGFTSSQCIWAYQDITIVLVDFHNGSMRHSMFAIHLQAKARFEQTQIALNTCMFVHRLASKRDTESERERAIYYVDYSCEPNAFHVN